jgi:hypothetical protein
MDHPEIKWRKREHQSANGLLGHQIIAGASSANESSESSGVQMVLTDQDHQVLPVRMDHLDQVVSGCIQLPRHLLRAVLTGPIGTHTLFY